MPKIVLFDMDGTLTDSAAIVTATMRQAIASATGQIVDQETLQSYVGPPLIDTIATYAPPGMSGQDMIDLYRSFYLKEQDRIPFFDQALTALKELRAAGYLIGLATSKEQRNAGKIISNHGLDQYFDVICGALSDTQATKAEIVGRALAQLHNPDPDQVVMVGDRIFDIEGASAHGVRTILVTWSGHVPVAEQEMAWATAGDCPTLLDQITRAIG